VRTWATRMLANREKGEKPITSYPYPLQIWKIGEQPLFSLGGELTSEYAIGLKKIFGTHIFVAGYSNDVMAYIPSELILKEGGYEGDRAQAVYGLPAKWATGIQDRILTSMVELSKEAGIQRKEK
jgi:neutral ceramidase